MSNPEMLREAAAESLGANTFDMKLEVVVIPVSDVNRAKRFYGDLGWSLDYTAGDDYRVIQFTPPGSGCSVIFGKNVTTASPGSFQGLHLIVSDIEAARDALLSRGIEISEPFHDAGGVFHHAGAKGLLSGPSPQRKKLRLVRLVQRSGRQRLAVTGGHRAIDRTHHGGRHKLHRRTHELGPPCGSWQASLRWPGRFGLTSRGRICGPGKVVTEVTPAGDFWEAEPQHQDYLERHPDGHTCY
jgi:catechol 2,3-dioxygenase-like lactoylglutathione lyase family enzyme